MHDEIMAIVMMPLSQVLCLFDDHKANLCAESSSLPLLSFVVWALGRRSVLQLALSFVVSPDIIA